MYIKKILLLLVTGIFFINFSYSAEYLLGPGDLVSISVFQNNDFDTEIRMSESGRISLPLLGGVNLQGKTESEAENILENLLRSNGYIMSPHVSVAVLEYDSKHASVLGKVHKPGEFTISSDDTIIGLISKAGGIKDDGNSMVTLYRRGNDPEKINIYATGENKDLHSNSIVNANDVIVVNEAEVFFTYGEVNKPGEYRLRDNMTVMQAISISGGLSDKATEKGLRIIRQTPQGKITLHKVELDEMVQPFDVIRVKESIF